MGLRTKTYRNARPREETRPKPNPEIYDKASKILGVKPKRCLVFEDSISGIMAAKKANMDYIRVPEVSAQNFYQTEPKSLVKK